MATTHISILKPFSGGDARKWLLKFEIYSGENRWDSDKKAKKFPTLLEALMAWMELTEDERKDFAAEKTMLIKKLAPLEFVSLGEFQKRTIFPSESVEIYIYI